MKEKILTGWNFQRVLFLLVGLLVIGQAVNSKEWLGIIFGAYFLVMATFALGCAGGSCKR